ncbi:hypothetical protein BJP40_06765 [Streptomyces sp. CC53]|uniref:hypothetical protein n=1 Tax=Streptomyces sp. CC53 TaxID=1906740 RepID=UPI0008DD06CF|nr:hypothetical protein [Streptomyces sp. CC53]OII61223.1 hypothetical protein BJP40_06765 [Streptomyces sp. CC53]
MAWTAPKTWVAEQVLTAAELNTHLRDNLLETAPAKATTEGSYFVVSDLNQIAERKPEVARVSAGESTSSTSYVDLATTGPEVTVTTGSSAIVLIYSQLRNTVEDSGSMMSFAISGATSRSALDTTAILHRGNANQSQRFSAFDMITDLTPGSNTFTAKYRVTADTGTFGDRMIAVFAL